MSAWAPTAWPATTRSTCVPKCARCRNSTAWATATCSKWSCSTAPAPWARPESSARFHPAATPTWSPFPMPAARQPRPGSILIAGSSSPAKRRSSSWSTGVRTHCQRPDPLVPKFSLGNEGNTAVRRNTALRRSEKGWLGRTIFYAIRMSLSRARETLELMLGHLGLVFEVEEIEPAGRLVLNIHTREAGRLIGRDGHTLEDLQYLLNRILNRNEEGASNVTVDVEGYRQKEKQDFLDRVRELAEQVRQTGQPFVLAPMNSFDRRLVHQAFADDPEIGTQSEE